MLYTFVGSSPLLIDSIYLKAGPAVISIICSRAEKATRKVMESTKAALFKVLCIAEIQRSRKGIIGNICIFCTGDTVLIFIKNGKEPIIG